MDTSSRTSTFGRPKSRTSSQAGDSVFLGKSEPLDDNIYFTGKEDPRNEDNVEPIFADPIVLGQSKSSLPHSQIPDSNTQNIFTTRMENNTGDDDSRESTFRRQQNFKSFLINSDHLSDGTNSLDRSLDRISNKENVPEKNIPQQQPVSMSSVIRQLQNSVVDIDGTEVQLRKKVQKPPVSKKPTNVKPQKSDQENPNGGIDSAAGKLRKNSSHIITNPKAMKKSSSSVSSKPLKSPTSAPNIGYFANGHYYDPNPMPVTSDPEVYAPGSNYSDRSNVMSTFLGDLPISRTASQYGSDT